jgi:hypothetical protein
MKKSEVKIVSGEEAIKEDSGYLEQVFKEIYKWEEEDKELAQGRSNFQIEKFFLLDAHTVPAAFQAALKNRRTMAEGFMQKVLEMKERQREFDYKWSTVEDKTQPIFWKTHGPAGGGGEKLCWYDLDKLQLENYIKTSELEIRDRVYQVEFLDKILNRLVEINGGPITRAQFNDEDHIYWERRFAEQAYDAIMQAKTGIDLGTIHSMRRGTAPTLLDDDENRIKNGFPSLSEAMDPGQSFNFLVELQNKIVQGYEEITEKNIADGLPHTRSRRFQLENEKRALLEKQKAELGTADRTPEVPQTPAQQTADPQNAAESFKNSLYNSDAGMKLYK